MTTMSGAEALVQSIKSYGVDTIFALPGAQLDPLFDVLYREQDSIRVIHTRHEQGTAYMAFGYAQSTGRVGVNLVVPGPGVLNAASGLCTAHACGAPVLCLAGQIPSKFIGQGIGQLHELADQPGALASVTKWRGRAESAADAPAKVQEAFVQLNTGRKQPVLLEMAPDIMARPGEVELLDPVDDFHEYDPEPDEDLVEQAAALLGNAENPGIFIGGGIYSAEEPLVALAEDLQAPVYTSPHGHGAIDARHYLAQNLMCAKDIWDTIDVVLAVGTRYQSPGSWPKIDGQKLIRIDIDPKQSLNVATPDIHIVSTAEKSLTQIVNRLQRHNKSRDNREEELAAHKSKIMADFATLDPQHSYAMVVREELADDGIACFDVTQIGFYAWFGFPVYAPRTMIQSGYQGTLGYVFPTALGAKVANPDKQVVAITGDGGFMFNVQELATAAQHGINTVTVVFNDSAFGNVKRNQKETFDGRYIASDLKNPDFVKLAEAFGVMGMRTDSPEGLRGALRETFKADGPALIEVQVGEMPSAWPFMPLVRAKDQTNEK